MKTICISGITGFLGKNLQKFFSEENIVVGLFRDDNIQGVLESTNPHIIINCAAEIYDDNSMFQSNVCLTETILNYVKNNPKTILIHIGSSSEYGSVEGRASSELDLINPQDLYSATKGCATLLCQGYARKYNLDIVIVRPYSLYGPHESDFRLIPRLTKSFIDNEPMKLVNGVHDFCYIDDFVYAIDIILKSEKREFGEIINVSNGIQYTNLRVYQYFKEIIGKEGNVNLLNEFVTYNNWICDNKKIKIKYNWSPQYTLKLGIQKYIEYYEQTREKSN